MPSNGTYRTKVPYSERAFKLERAAGRKNATAVYRGRVSVGCQTVDTDNDEGGLVPKNTSGDAGRGEQVGMTPGCELTGKGGVDNTGCKSRKESGGVTNVNEVRKVTWEEIHAIRSRGSKNKGGEGSASNMGGVVTREGGVDNTGCKSRRESGGVTNVNEIREVTWKEKQTPCSLVIDIKVGGVGCEAVIDSGAQVTVVSRRLWNVVGKGAVIDTVKIKGATQDTMMADIVENVEIEAGGVRRGTKIFVADISDDCIFGLDCMKLFKMVVDLNKGVVGVGHSVVAGKLKYVGGERVPLYPMRTVRRLKLKPEMAMLVRVNIEGGAQGEVVMEPSFPDCRFFMPSTVMDCASGWEDLGVWLLNDSRETMLLPQGTLLGVGQQLVEGEVAGEGQHGEKGGGSVAEIKRLSEPTGTDAELPSHLEEMFRKAGSQLTREQGGALKNLLVEYGDIFAKHEMDLGEFSEVTHKIEVGGAKPVQFRPRRTPMAFEKEEKEHLEKLLAAKIISPGVSEWASPTVLVRKKDGSVRYCVDLRGVNKATVKDKYPLPKISECIDALAGCDYFSCLDMANGYYQLKMEEGDRDKTAFVTKYGMFLFNRMPFGLCNAPATFSRALALVLRGLSWDCVVSFLDDLIILGKGFEDHLTNMEKVFARFAKFKLKLKPKKCELFQREVIFLGHRVSGEGVAPNPSKIQEVQRWATPADRKQLESFLGLANYYREYVKGFAEVAAPLHALKGGKQPFSWGEEEQTAFEELKKKVNRSSGAGVSSGGGRVHS